VPGPSVAHRPAAVDPDGAAAWRAARRLLDGAEPPPFAWPLPEPRPAGPSASIPPDLLD
jgi:hypothetical protein